MRARIAYLVMVIAPILGVSWGQEAGMDPVDTPFVIAAGQGDLYEITSSQLAQQQGSDQAVIDFAQRMIDDHSASTERLTEITRALGIELPSRAGPDHEVMISALMPLQGEEFDRAYMQQQVLMHQVAVSLFGVAAEHAQNEELRSFAQETLPALEEHLRMAQELAQATGAP